MRYLSLAEVLLLHRLVMEQGGQQPILRDLGALESAVAQPRQTFGGEDLYPSLVSKAAALGFSLIQNHPFLDGNKRVGHAAMVAFLRVNGRRLEATVDEAERTILQVASLVHYACHFAPSEGVFACRPVSGHVARTP